MRPKIYNEAEDKNGTQPVNLKIVGGKNIVPTLQAVNEKGEYVVTILLFKANGVYASTGVKTILQRHGYDTSWAEWNINGQIKLDY